MKLPNFLEYAPLNSLRDQMGTSDLGDFTVDTPYHELTVAELDRLYDSGIEVSMDDVRVLSDGTLAYKDSRVLVYIRDVNTRASYYRQAKSDYDKMPKFHLVNCKTLRDMRQSNRFSRYVVATRDDGMFVVNLNSSNPGTTHGDVVPLDVCQYCLGYLRYHDFSHDDMTREVRRKIVRNFKIADFFKAFPQALHKELPEYRDDTAPLNEYPDNWDAISKQMKAARSWLCESCGISLDAAKHRNYLHVHHTNGEKWDCGKQNLQVLCMKCHAEQPKHGHVKQLPAYDEFISLWHRLPKDGQRNK